jgi:hypothetical protein
MSRTIRWALALLTTIFMIAAALSVTTTPAQAATGDLPDGWTWDDIRDQCGTANDAFMVPWRPDDDYYTLDNGQVVSELEWHPTNGVLTHTIELRDSMYNLMGGPWTITYTNEPCGELQPNVYTYEFGQCNQSSGYTPVVIHRINPEDGGDPIPEQVIRASRESDGTTASGLWAEVADGQVGDAYLGQDWGGLLSGRQKVSIFDSDNLYNAVKVIKFEIPACGPDDGDPVFNTPTPTAQLTKLSHRRMKVTLNNSKLDHATTFRLIVNPKQGKTKRTKVSVPAGMTVSTTCGMSGGLKRIRRTCNTRHGTVYTVKAQVGSHWKRLARKRL